MSRKTIANPAGISGVGLHLGEQCNLRFLPAESGSGISFKRIDIDGQPVIPAYVDQVTASERRTQIGYGSAAIHTVEHVLSAVAGLNIDDILIEMDGPEPPIADGSSAPFVEVLQNAGVVEIAGEPKYIRLSEPIRIIDGASVYEAFPADELSLDVTVEFPHPIIGKQSGEYSVTTESYIRELSRARTFGFIHEVEGLRSKGLIKGASTQNAVVLDEAGVVENELRWHDEFVRHKAMDCVGDLALSGARVLAKVVAVKPSHRGTVTLVKEIVRMANQTRNTMTDKMNIDQIMKVLPHRYPFLLVDRIIEFGDNKIVGIKNVTINEPFFQGHFPGHPIMPGVLIIEAMAQVGGMLMMGTVDEPENKVVYFISLDNVRWRKPVTPGDQLRFELEVVQIRGTVCKMRGVAKVDGEIAAEADMAAMIRDR